MDSQQNSFLDDEEKESIGLLTSLLVRYPELSSLNYCPWDNSLNLNFILKGRIREAILQELSEQLILCIHTYLHFEKKDVPKQVIIKYDYELDLTKIVITRDAQTLTPNEISLIIILLSAHLKNLLIYDESTIFNAEDLPLQDDYIKYMLDNLQPRKYKNKIIALREEGRVFVFKQ